ncbi:MAG: hypothetical protein HQK78_14785, partial [Desulfobacterales bacterium]|nr:hypothetical protein [Desulfobacterales bacterium]
LEAIEEASKIYNIAKSHLAQEAFTLWLKKQTEIYMSKGYEEMAQDDKEIAEMSLNAQREIL